MTELDPLNKAIKRKLKTDAEIANLNENITEKVSDEAFSRIKAAEGGNFGDDDNLNIKDTLNIKEEVAEINEVIAENVSDEAFRRIKEAEGGNIEYPNFISEKLQQSIPMCIYDVMSKKDLIPDVLYDGVITHEGPKVIFTRNGHIIKTLDYIDDINILRWMFLPPSGRFSKSSDIASDEEKLTASIIMKQMKNPGRASNPQLVILGNGIGDVKINKNDLLKGHLLATVDGKELINDDDVDKTVIKMLTRRFDRHEKYSPKAIRYMDTIFRNANVKSGSGKLSLEIKDFIPPRVPNNLETMSKNISRIKDRRKGYKDLIDETMKDIDYYKTTGELSPDAHEKIFNFLKQSI